MAQLTLSATGHASKRGLIPRLLPADRLLAEMELWLRAEYPDAVRSTRTRTSPTGQRVLYAGLHPAAPDAWIQASDEGDIEVFAALAPVGPGYQTFVARLFQRLGQEHGITWMEAVEEGRSGFDMSSGLDRTAAERAYLAWLGGGLIGARDARRKGIDGIHLGTPADVRYTFDGAIATHLGPRDDAWLEAAVTDSRLAIDVTPWWADATDARCLLNRALCLMWTDVRWRTPVDDAERAIHDEVLRSLARAFPLDPSLPYPWREWHELATIRGTTDAMTRQVETRAARAEATAPIGYRREPIRVLHEGWELEIPGNFAERRTDEEWWGGEAGRGITLAATETGTESGPMPPEAFLAQVAPDLGSDALTHEFGDLIGRARLSTDASSGVEVGVLEGYSAVRGRGAAIRIVFDDSADWRWALDVWRALSPLAREATAPA